MEKAAKDTPGYQELWDLPEQFDAGMQNCRPQSHRCLQRLSALLLVAFSVNSETIGRNPQEDEEFDF